MKKEKDGDNLEVIKSSTEALSAEMQKIGQYMSQQNPTGNPQQETSNQTGGEGNVRDADFKEEPNADTGHGKKEGENPEKPKQ